MNATPKTGVQISLRQILLLCAVAAITFAWPIWVSDLRGPQDGWERRLCLVFYKWLPVALPLTILVLGGMRQFPWLLAGVVAAVCLLGELRLELAHRTINLPEMTSLVVLFSGLTISCLGSIGMACDALLARRWWTAAFWAVLAAGAGFECWAVRWLVLYQ
jgi:hypothetical protein